MSFHDLDKHEQEVLVNTLKLCGSANKSQALDAGFEVAKALELPLRQGVLNGDILDGIFEPIKIDAPATPEFPLDLLPPGTEEDFVAYTLPNHGYIPQRHVEGDYVMVPTYDLGGAIDTNRKYVRNARWDVISRMLDVLEGQFTKKLNDDGWYTLISAAFDRNVVVFDSDAAAGQFTKRVVSLGKLLMRRNGGGNSTSVNRGKMTDMAISPEAMEDIRNWNVDQVDELTRREIMVSPSDNALSRIFNVNLRDIDEFGEGQEYNTFYTDELSGTFPSDKKEIAIGLDLEKNDSLVMPLQGELEVFPDDTLHRQRRVGWYGELEGVGFAVLDSRRTVLIAI